MSRVHRYTYLVVLVALSVALAGCTLFNKEPVPAAPFSVSYPISVPSEAIASIKAVSSDKVAPLELTRGPGIKAAALLNGFSSDGWNHAGASLEVAIEKGMYYQFGLTVKEGYTVSLTDLDLWVRRSGATAPYNAEVHVSLDGFKTPGIKVADFTYRGRVSGTAPAEDPLVDDPYYYLTNDLPGRPNTGTSVGDHIPTMDLTKIEELKDLPAGTTVTFRLYAWGDDKTTDTNTFALGRVRGPVIKGVATPVK